MGVTCYHAHSPIAGTLAPALIEKRLRMVH